MRWGDWHADRRQIRLTHAVRLWKVSGTFRPAVDSAYGDSLAIGVYLTDASGNLTVTHNNSTQYLSYYIDDATSGVYWSGADTVQYMISGTHGATANITGNSAEWIVEDLSLPLTHFSDVAMTDSYYYDQYSRNYLRYGSNKGTGVWILVG